MKYPIAPTAIIPRKHIFIDSQSSLLLGLVAILSILTHWDRKFLTRSAIFSPFLKNDSDI